MDAPAKVLIVGASGTVGSELLQQLPAGHPLTVLRAAHRDRALAPDERFVDFTDYERSAASLASVDAAFLLLPPGLNDAAARFRETLKAVPEGHLPHLVFMSVQGAETRGFLPHANIETVIRERAAREPGPPPFTFLRPSYFMQDLETAFGEDIRQHRRLRVPAGAGTFVWIDAIDIARAAATVLLAPGRHAGHAYTLTGTDVLNFREAAAVLSETWHTPITYESPNPVVYYFELRRRGTPAGMALAQTAIHAVQRFTATAPVSPDFTYLTGRKPTRLAEYAARVAPAFGV